MRSNLCMGEQEATAKRYRGGWEVSHTKRIFKTEKEWSF